MGAPGAITKAAREAESLLLMGPDETGGDIQVATSKVVGATEIVEGLVITNGMVPTEQTGASFKLGLPGGGGGIWVTKGS